MSSNTPRSIVSASATSVTDAALANRSMMSPRMPRLPSSFSRLEFVDRPPKRTMISSSLLRTTVSIGLTRYRSVVVVTVTSLLSSQATFRLLLPARMVEITMGDRHHQSDYNADVVQSGHRVPYGVDTLDHEHRRHEKR